MARIAASLLESVYQKPVLEQAERGRGDDAHHLQEHIGCYQARKAPLGNVGRYAHGNERKEDGLPASKSLEEAAGKKEEHGSYCVSHGCGGRKLSGHHATKRGCNKEDQPQHHKGEKDKCPNHKAAGCRRPFCPLLSRSLYRKRGNADDAEREQCVGVHKRQRKEREHQCRNG